MTANNQESNGRYSFLSRTNVWETNEGKHENKRKKKSYHWRNRKKKNHYEIVQSYALITKKNEEKHNKARWKRKTQQTTKTWEKWKKGKIINFNTPQAYLSLISCSSRRPPLAASFPCCPRHVTASLLSFKHFSTQDSLLMRFVYVLLPALYYFSTARSLDLDSVS